jgi:subtilisin
VSKGSSLWNADVLATALAKSVAHLRSEATRTVRVAVVDSGVDGTHPDLQPFMERAYGVNMVEGVAQVSDEVSPGSHDGYGHGTAVASVITRIAPNAKITDYRVLGKDNTGAGAALVRGFEHAVEQGFDVINMSLAAKADFAPRLSKLCDVAYRKGIVVVAAKRNMPLVDMGYPAELTSVISVDRSKFEDSVRVLYRPDSIIEFVGHGEEVTVAAPGGRYTTKTGTSFATPAISGVVALLLGAHPGLRPFEVKSYLRALSPAAGT